MKKHKGKGSKHQGKKSARLKTVWFKNEKDIPTRAIVPKNIDDMKLKDSAIKNAGAFPNSNEHIIEAIKNGVYPPDFSSTKPKSQQKPSASVHCINEAREAKGLQPIGTPTAASKRFETQQKILDEMAVYSRWAALSQGRDWYQGKAEWSARVTLKMKEHYSGKAGHESKPDETKKGEFIPASNPDQLCLPPPEQSNYVMLTQDLIDKEKATKKQGGYSFAYRKPEVKTGLTPSGKPISDFLQGGKYAPKLHSVTTELHSAHVAKYRSSANDDRCEDTGLLKYPGSSIAGREWYRNNVPPDYTPDIVHEFDALERDLAKALQSKHILVEDNFDLQEENEALKDEIHLLKSEINFAYWEISINRGEDVKPPSLEELRNKHQSSEKVESLSTESLANLFNVFAVRHRDNPLHAFCTVHGVSIEQEQELRAYFDRQCEQRVAVTDERGWCRRMAKRYKTKPIVHRKAVNIKQEIRQLRAIRSNNAMCKVRDDLPLMKERMVYKRWGTRTARPMCTERINYHQWWVDNLTPQQSEDRSLMVTTTYKVLKKAKDILTAELLPWKRKENKQRAINAAKTKAKLRAKSLKQKTVEASRIKELQEKKLQEQELRQRIREAQRLAY